MTATTEPPEITASPIKPLPVPEVIETVQVVHVPVLPVTSMPSTCPGANGLRCSGGVIDGLAVTLLSTYWLPKADARKPKSAPAGTGRAFDVLPGSVL